VSNPNGAQVWSTEDWTPVTRVFTGHAGPIYWATISRDNRTLATSSWDGTVRLWDIKTEQAIGAPLPRVSIGLQRALFRALDWLGRRLQASG
jgi:WD40 repeat protein